MLKESIQDRRHSKVKWGPAYLRENQEAKRSTEWVRERKVRPGWESAGAQDVNASGKPKRQLWFWTKWKHDIYLLSHWTRMLSGQLNEATVSKGKEDSWVGTGLSRRESVSMWASRFSLHSTINQLPVWKLSGNWAQRQGIWEQGSVAGYLLVGEPPGSVSTVTINQSSVWNQNCTQKTLQWLCTFYHV